MNQNGELFGKGQHNKCSISGFPGRSAPGCGCTISRNAQMTVYREPSSMEILRDALVVGL